jgi:hypothetical protein
MNYLSSSKKRGFLDAIDQDALERRLDTIDAKAEKLDDEDMWKDSA